MLELQLSDNKFFLKFCGKWKVVVSQGILWYGRKEMTLTEKNTR